jgi:hypothetical protein
VPKTWEKELPNDLEIDSSDFVSQKFLDEQKLTLSDGLKRDLEDLQQHLLPFFFKASQKARYYQNRYYLFRWIFALGALLTTLLGTLTVLFSIPAQSDPASSTALFILTIFTGVLAAITAVINAWDQFERPVEQWFTCRSIVEQLRKHYFLYLSHFVPYEGSKRLSKLKRTVSQLYHSGDPKSLKDQIEATQTDLSAPSPTLEKADILTLIKIYQNRRIRKQIAFYGDRTDEFRINLSGTFILSVLFIAGTTVLAMFNSSRPSTIVPCMMAIFPAAAAFLLSFQQIYDWDRQVKLYDDALKQLRPLDIDCDDALTAEDPQQAYIEVAAKAERAFQSEGGQWGQPVFANAENPPLTSHEIIEGMISDKNLSQEEADQIRAILNR